MASVENSSLKRQRDDDVSELEETKKHKTYNHILSILEDEEEEPTQDLSSLITTLQQELSEPEPESAGSELPSPSPADPEENPPAVPSNSEDSSESESSVSNEEDEKERVMRHLLEASDDELGIPNAGDEAAGVFSGGGDGFVLCDGLWEFEDEAANYYTLLQSELFM